MLVNLDKMLEIITGIHTNGGKSEFTRGWNTAIDRVYKEVSKYLNYEPSIEDIIDKANELGWEVEKLNDKWNECEKYTFKNKENDLCCFDILSCNAKVSRALIMEIYTVWRYFDITREALVYMKNTNGNCPIDEAIELAEDSRNAIKELYDELLKFIDVSSSLDTSDNC